MHLFWFFFYFKQASISSAIFFTCCIYFELFFWSLSRTSNLNLFRYLFHVHFIFILQFLYFKPTSINLFYYFFNCCFCFAFYFKNNDKIESKQRKQTLYTAGWKWQNDLAKYKLQQKQRRSDNALALWFLQQKQGQFWTKYQHKDNF